VTFPHVSTMESTSQAKTATMSPTASSHWATIAYVVCCWPNHCYVVPDCIWKSNPK
jgi:hypothetical protein